MHDPVLDDEAVDADGEDDSEGDDDDAEGEDDDDIVMAAPNFVPHSFGDASHQRVGSSANTFGHSQSLDLLRNVNPEDFQVLLNGLGNIPISTESDFNFPTGPLGDSFAMRPLYEAVDNLQARLHPLHQHSHMNDHAAHADRFALSTPNTSSDRQCAGTPHPGLSTATADSYGSLGLTLGPMGTGAPILQPPAAPTGISRAHTPALTRTPAFARTPLARTPLARATALSRTPSLELEFSPLQRVLGLSQTSPEDQAGYDSDASGPSTPVAWGDTDIGLTEDSVLAPSSSVSKFSRMLHQSSQRDQTLHPRRPPTLLQLRSNARKVHVTRRKRRVRRSAHDPNVQPLRVGLRASQLTLDQQSLMPAIELYLAKNMFLTNPWPEDHDQLWRDAIEYAEAVSGVEASPEVATQAFKDTGLSKLSSLRSNPLLKVEYMVEERYRVSSSRRDAPAVFELMKRDSFLYPTTDCAPNQFFRVGPLGDTIIIILFRSSKEVGLDAMEEMNKQDNLTKCSEWHAKLRDRTAIGGVPPGLIALAATMMFWALQNLYVDSKVRFEEMHFQSVWDRYHRALLALPHLGRLRIELLEHIQMYYMEHWPAPEPDDDDNTPLAWL